VTIEFITEGLLEDGERKDGFENRRSVKCRLVYSSELNADSKGWEEDTDDV